MTPLRPSAIERPGSGDRRASAPEPVRVWMLGGFRVSVGSKTLDEGGWRLRKAKSLIKLLALSPGHRLHREVLMDRLWPELGPEEASNNLRQVLHAARGAFGRSASTPHPYVRLQDEEIVLCPEGPRAAVFALLIALAVFLAASMATTPQRRHRHGHVR